MPKGNVASARQDCPLLQDSLEWYFHLVKGMFSLVRELACTTELKSFAVGSLAAGGDVLAGYVLREVPEREIP